MSEDAILTDGMFWARLARATGASMAASSDKELRRQWVDDFIPESCKPSNDGLRAEGVAHLMGHKNGRFGDYRFLTFLPWALVRHRNRQPIVEEIDLDHGRQELRLVVTVVAEEPNSEGSTSRQSQLGPAGRVAHLKRSP